MTEALSISQNLESTHIGVSPEIGRRIYIQEHCLILEGLRDVQRLVNTTRFITSLTLPRTLAHSASEIELFTGVPVKYGAEEAITELNMRDAQSAYLHGLEIKDGQITKQILSVDENIVANCYFSNYFTLATNENSAKVMFQDNSSISEIKGLHPRGLTLIKPRDLVHRLKSNIARDWYDDILVEESVELEKNAIEKLVNEKNTTEHAPEMLLALNSSAERTSLKLKNMFNAALKS